MLLADKRVFIIEDDATNLAIMSAVLRRGGAAVIYDRWGVKTTNIMQKAGRIDAILLDLNFPGGVTGYDVYDKIQTYPDLKDIPVVVVSASDPDLNLSKVKDKGMQGFICKPINNKTFCQSVAQIVAGEEVWDVDVDMLDLD